jgi:hypothetical protein
MVFNATFNTISAISWRSVLEVEDTGVPEENHQPAKCHSFFWYQIKIERRYETVTV